MVYLCDFGTILKQLRKSHNLTQKELGLKIGLSKAVISKYENGMGYPTFDVLIHISEYFGVTTDYLLGVSKGKTIDVSLLTDSQIETIHRIISEFNKSNTPNRCLQLCNSGYFFCIQRKDGCPSSLYVVIVFMITMSVSF